MPIFTVTNNPTYAYPVTFYHVFGNINNIFFGLSWHHSFYDDLETVKTRSH